MATHPHLANAPITEALVDIRVGMPDGWDPELLQRACSFVSDQYPESEEQRFKSFRLALRDDKPVTEVASDAELKGFTLKSSDSAAAVQFRRDGFTFNKFRPYRDWESTFAEAWRLWEIFRDNAQPAQVIRIALRYVNHLPLAARSGLLSDYLTCAPNKPEGSPGSITAFLGRMTLQDVSREQPKAQAVLTQSMAPDPRSGAPSLLLDVDVSKNQTYMTTAEAIREDFHDLRTIKNDMFFAAITEHVVEMCQ